MAGIDSDLIRGHIDTIILKALYHGDKYGLEIIQEIEEKSNGTYELKQPTLYSCLKRLESQGLISSYWQDSEIGGKRHYYKLTDQGLATYKANQEEWLRSREIIDNLIYNTTIEYAPIYDDDNEKNAHIAKQVSDDEEETEIVEPKEDKETEPNAEENEDQTLATTVISPTDYQADVEQTDEFASFDTASTSSNSFFAANNEVANNDEFDNATTTSPSSTKEDEHEDLVSLNLDAINEETSLSEDIEEQNETLLEEPQENDSAEELLYEEPNIIEESETSEEDINLDNDQLDDDQIYSPSEDQTTSTDDEIYTANQEETDVEDEQEIYSPTYINFGTNNSYQEADLTSAKSEEPQEELTEQEPENQAKVEPEESYYNYYNQENTISDNDDNTETTESKDDSIAGTASNINEQYYSSTIPHASEEEINNLYRTTENYENLQAGYTDETYKQMLSALESYSSTPSASAEETTNNTILTISELSDKLETEGIILRKHTKQIKESDDSKMYVKTNQIHMVKNWITFSITTLIILLTFGIMSAFKGSYTYNFAFWQFVVAIAVSLIIPAYSTIKYLINPYKKVVAKYAPRLSILLSVLITVQLILVIYCLNLQLGFYSFSQENYCHLLWILPLILSFIPILQSLIYYPLYNSKRFHI